jgi:tRNA-dihydrouridine synthase
MIGRGALGNPWIFRELNGGPKPTAEERCETVLRHFRQHLVHHSEARVHKDELDLQARAAKDERMGVHSFRSHLAWYAHGLYGAAAFRSEVMKLDRARDVETAVERFFLGAQVDAQAMAADQEDVDYRAALG